ncbi:NAD kinase [Spirochaetia bacterium]|nr:NAD kinase [Spirochaetia bacterium]
MAGFTLPRVQRALLFVNYRKSKAAALVEEVTRELERLGIAAVIYPFEGRGEAELEPGFDIALSFGGDGTVLYAARAAAPFGIPILPINIGTLGFIAAVPPGEWLPVFTKWLAGEEPESPRLMLDLTVERRGETVTRLSCLNEAVVSASGIAKIIRLDVSAEAMRLGHYRSDGLIVATPTGSTAYSVAAGGPILDPEIEALIINPICPFTLSNRPVVVPAHQTVIVEVEEEQRSGVLLTVDGQVTEKLESGDRILIRKAPYEARLIGSDRDMFYRALQTKLNWSGGFPHA